jgi:hypothetical protein
VVVLLSLKENGSLLRVISQLCIITTPQLMNRNSSVDIVTNYRGTSWEVLCSIDGVVSYPQRSDWLRSATFCRMGTVFRL